MGESHAHPVVLSVPGGTAVAEVTTAGFSCARSGGHLPGPFSSFAMRSSSSWRALFASDSSSCVCSINLCACAMHRVFQFLNFIHQSGVHARKNSGCAARISRTCHFDPTHPSWNRPRLRALPRECFIVAVSGNYIALQRGLARGPQA